jgi:hypothetical protein
MMVLMNVNDPATKVFTRFDPTPQRTPQECERHYRTVHVPFAQDQLRPMTGLISYHVNRAVAQADVAGGFAQRPSAWRFVILRFTAGHALAFDAHQQATVNADHVNCLYRLRSCPVRETVELDRRSGQPTLAKFVVEVDAEPGADPDQAAAAWGATIDAVRNAMDGAFGARLLLANEVLGEGRTERVAVEGQRPTGVIGPTDKLGYLECYFDHERWGREALGPLARAGGLRRPGLSGPAVLHVREECALDLR